MFVCKICEGNAIQPAMLLISILTAFWKPFRFSFNDKNASTSYVLHEVTLKWPRSNLFINNNNNIRGTKGDKKSSFKIRTRSSTV